MVLSILLVLRGKCVKEESRLVELIYFIIDFNFPFATELVKRLNSHQLAGR